MNALVLVEHGRNKELLLEWLGGREDLVAVDGAARVDLVLADTAALQRRRERIESLRERERPAYVPLLLVVGARQGTKLPRDVWQIADEVLTTPVRRSELSLRVGRLLALRRSSVATARRLDELGRSNVDLEQFAYVAAHELAAPLAVVTGALETIAARYRDRFEESVLPLLDAADGESRRLQTLISDLLAFSQAGRPLQMEEIDLSDVVHEAIGVLAPQIDAHDVAIEVESLPRVRADARQLRLVFTNLVGNAIKYREPGITPRVHIACADVGGHYELSVADNGRGVSPERTKTIFEMFDRGEGSAQTGHGIGLALCRRIVERHDGEIWVEPRPDGGSVFRFTLRKG